MTKQRKPRKPQGILWKNRNGDIRSTSIETNWGARPIVDLGVGGLDGPKECRRLAAWLLKAAAWMEARK